VLWSAIVGEDMSSRRTVPYEADYEEVVLTKQPDGKSTEVKRLFRLFRDSRGRWRQECTLTTETGAQLPTIVFLIDFASGHVRLLDLQTGNLLNESKLPTAAGALQAMMSTRQTASTPRPAPPDQTSRREDLGQKEIDGLPATGRRITTDDAVTEIWSTPVIDQPELFYRSVRSDREETKRLFNIKLREPDPTLFAALDTKQ
jgi:hypothetical protein